MVENVILKSKGAKWYHSDDYHSPNMTKNSMGEFFHNVLKTGAQIGDIWVFNYKYDRSSVFVSVFMTEEMKQEIETNTKFKFKNPPKIKLN